MNLDEYQDFFQNNQDFYFAIKAESGKRQLSEAEKLYVIGLSIGEETGEVAKELRKSIRDNRDPNLVKLSSEMGDLLGDIACLASYFGLSLEEIASQSIEKFRNRYMGDT